jgi:hypothetical protein
MRERLIAEIDRLEELAAELMDIVIGDAVSPLWNLIEKYNRLIEAM